MLQFEEMRYIACQNRHICSTLERVLRTAKGEKGGFPSFSQAEKVLDIFDGVWDVLCHRGLPWLHSPERWPKVKSKILGDPSGRSISRSGAAGEEVLRVLVEALEEENDPQARLAWERLVRHISP